MNHVDTTLFFNELRFRALEEELAEDGRTVADELRDAFTTMYESLVPEEKRFAIEAEIQKTEAEEQAAAEASRRFGVFHIHEDGTDSYFISELFQSLYSTAYRYRLYERGEISGDPQSFASTFREAIPIAADQYDDLCDQMPNDPRIQALIDYDLDTGVVSACESSDNAWWSYRLRDLSVAAFKAHRSNYRISVQRMQIFADALEGKEIAPVDESMDKSLDDTQGDDLDDDQSEGPIMQM